MAAIYPEETPVALSEAVVDEHGGEVFPKLIQKMDALITSE